jgi:hypothetical protein
MSIDSEKPETIRADELPPVWLNAEVARDALKRDGTADYIWGGSCRGEEFSQYWAEDRFPHKFVHAPDCPCRNAGEQADLALLSLVYAAMLRSPLNVWRVMNDHLLAALRDRIALRTGRDAEDVQNEAEAAAHAATNGYGPY